MKTIKEFLEKEKEEMPKWLENYEKGQKLDFDEILNHKIVFYPGSGEDGQAIKTFNNAHFAHTFLYVDYSFSKEAMLELIDKNEAFKGYKLLDFRDCEEKDLVPTGWVQHHFPKQKEEKSSGEKPYCILAIFEREDGFGEEHGAKRFAVLFLYADGFATFDAMFINKQKAPDLILVQDHGWGGNYNTFGKGGLLEELALKFKILPKYIMCEEKSAWAGYKKVEDVASEIGGMHRNIRFLFKKA